MFARVIQFAFVLAFSFFVHASPDAPAIKTIRTDSTNILITVSVPAGIQKVTLETRSRLEGSAWAPKAVKRFESATAELSEITFTVARSESLEILRIRTDEKDSLPAAFFKGTSSFPGGVDSGPGRAGPGGVFPGSVMDMGAPESAQGRSVVESDIWKIAGDTLYFFNATRGLQLIDISDPASPALRSTFSLAASGEQMYVLDSGHAVLLTRSWCSYGSPGDEARVLVIDANGAKPALAAEVSVPGWIIESRMVGSALYVVSQTYRTIVTAQGETWESATLLTAIDLANPAAPIKRKTDFLSNYSRSVMATERYLFAAGWDYRSNRTAIQIVDISSPNGDFSTLSSIEVAGDVPDKFKMNLDGDVFTVISHSWNFNARWGTTLENYSLANPALPVKVGSLSLAQGEQLHATRFDGKRVYVVTYLRVDPLWIVDLSDPARPHIAGELHVPGWSTYLRPLGNDRLLALGVDDTNSWRVALSLFDVSNASSPALLSKVVMGENNSWSEANADEKALTVLPDSGLVLVPWNSYSGNDAGSHVQLVDLGANTLAARGKISGHDYARRASLHKNHIVSLSGRKLISHDATNRDRPQHKATLDLAWPVGKVLLSGDYLIEFEFGSYSGAWGGSQPGVIRVARAEAPDAALTTVALGAGLPIAGADIRDGKLYVAQSRSDFAPWIIFADATGNPPPANTEFILSVWDLSQMPALPKISETLREGEAHLGGSLNAHWPKPGIVVWAGGSDNSWWSWGRGWGGPMMMDALWWPGFWGGDGGGRFIAFDVSNAAAPVFKSEVNLSTNGFWGFSKALTAGSLLYVSHQQQEVIELPIDPTTPPPPTGWNDNSNQTTRTASFTKYFLDVIDYTDPANPVFRKAVNIPGQLRGLSHDGGVLYTTGMHFNNEGQSDGQEFLDVTAYDGTAAFRVDSLTLTNWPRSILVSAGDIFIGQASGAASVDRWRLNEDGVLKKLSTTPSALAVQDIRFLGDLAVFFTGAETSLFDARDRSNLKQIGQADHSCLGAHDLKNADGNLSRGLYSPQSDYGVLFIPVNP